MPSKTKKVDPKIAKKLYGLLADSELISESERQFWLANFSALPESAQKQLIKIIEHTEKEFKKENDDHMSRVAEINTKCMTQLGKLAKAHKNLVNVSEEEVITAEDDFDEEEILAELREAGEI